MKIITATFTNYRLLKNLTIDFSTDHKKPLTVIRGDNDSGKTTILDALQWGFFGNEAIPVRNAKNYRMSSFKEDKQSETKVEITFQANDIKYIAIRRVTEIINLENDEYIKEKDEFDLLKSTPSGYNSLPNPSIQLKSILGSNVRELFFINGDKAMSFVENADNPNTKTKVQNAIDDMLNIHLIKKAKERVDNATKKIQKNLVNSSSDEEVKKIHEILLNCQSKIKDEEEKYKKYKEELSLRKKKLNMCDDQLAEGLKKCDKEKLNNNLNTFNSNIGIMEEEISNITKDFAKSIYSNDVFSKLLSKKLKSAYQRLSKLKKEGKYPKTVYPALQELLDKEKCICGDQLKPNSEKYNIIKEIVDNQDSNSAYDDEIIELTVRSNIFINDGEKAIKEIDSLYNQLDQKKTVLKDLNKEKAELLDKINQIPDQKIKEIKVIKDSIFTSIELMSKKIVTSEFEIEKLNDDLKSHQSSLENATKGHEEYKSFQNQKTASEDLSNVLDRVYNGIINEQIPLLNNYLKKYFIEIAAVGKKNLIITDVKISNDYEILVSGSEGKKINTTNALNGASRRALTLSFCLGITNVTNTKAPLLIDTPLGMMDPFTKKKCIEVLLKNSSHQIILFLTRSEINDIQDSLIEFAGTFQTITNTEHYYGEEKKLANEPKERMSSIVCNCDINTFCKICERKDDKKDDKMKEKVS